MKEQGIDAYIVPGNDPHASEYMAPHWAEMSWLTGFLGETGTAVVTAEKALLWTDSRYYLQAEAELAGSTIELMRESDVDCPSISQWIISNFKFQVSGSPVVAVNPEMYSVNDYATLRKELGESGIKLRSADLIAPIWIEGRPEIPMNPLYIYDDRYAGETVTDKLLRVREALAERGAEAAIIAELDEIGWLLNVRGTDVEYTPCVIAYCVVEKDRCTLFIDANKVSNQVAEELSTQNIDLRPYSAIREYLQGIHATRVLLDGNRVNEALYEALPETVTKVNATPSPIQVMMSVKNATEIAGERIAMRRDAVALVRFFRWLETEALKTPQTEISIAEQLHAFRAQGENFTDESFCTIAGWKSNGAIVHYHATPEACAKIEGNGVLLLDSGGQYLDGTTDITRTVWVGDEKAIPEEVKHDFTLVLKGHIALACARFPKGTRGNQLDILARQYMWQEGIHYGHGTGHGVGHFMGCHEGPANIRTDNNTNPIKEGNIFSDEPGIYRTNEYGIRTENVLVTRAAFADSQPQRSTGEQYYEFETLTLCPYDTRLMDTAMMTETEKAWVNNYHAWVYNEISPLLSKDEKAYLKAKCRAI